MAGRAQIHHRARFFLTAVACSVVALAHAEDLPRVHVLATGGTIAAAPSDDQGTTYGAGELSVDTLIRAVPQIRQHAHIVGEQIANIGSQDMTDAIWLKLATRVNVLLANEDVDGVVITHGTDTLEETALFLHLTVRRDKPVVLTGAMRSPDELGADGPRNLCNAVHFAATAHPRAQGIFVVMGDEVHGASDVTKTHITSVSAFTSPNRGPFGRLAAAGSWMCRASGHTLLDPSDTQREPVFDVSNESALPSVEIIYAHANMNRALIDAALASGAKGLVIAGVGNGNMSAAALNACAAAVQQGVPVVRASRVPAGTVSRNIEVNDDKLGFIAAQQFNPQKARVLLQLALTEYTVGDTAKVQRLFDDPWMPSP